MLAYFGEQLSDPCGHCDNCEAGTADRPERRRAARIPRPVAPLPAASGEHRPFPVSSVVRHREWGAGMVMGYEHDRVVVLFDNVGYKTLSVPVVRRRGLLTAD